MSAFRLSHGGLVDRSRSIGFRFDGDDLRGYEGDTLASALLASDRLLVGRSFKYHRPRGIVTAGSSEPNALLTIGTGARSEANTRATVQELYEGLVAKSQNRWPSLKHDFGAINGLLSPFLGAGFYYKTFMWPAAFWEKVYEPIIRRAAGLGRAVMEADPDRYEKAWAHCDLLVIGAGPAGLMAALTAARAGLRVILADEGFRLGGSLLSERVSIGNAAAADFVRDVLQELASLDNVTVMARTTVFGWYDDNVFGAVEKVQKHLASPSPDLPVERLWRIAAKFAILASGAEERPLVFGGNDRPGVMMASAARTYLNRFGVGVGRKVAVFTNGGSGYQAARDLASQGAEIAAVIDGRASAGEAMPAGTRMIVNAGVTKTLGRHRIEGLVVERSGHEETIDCDALLMSGGWSPVIHLACQRGAKPVWSEELQAFVAPDVGPRLRLAGSAAGLSGIGDCLRDGSAKALDCLAALGKPGSAPEMPEVEGEYDAGFAPLWYVPGAKDKAFVDFQNDVHVRDLSLAQREGFGHIEHTKRYTTLGMATDQGKTSNINGLAIAAAAVKRPAPAVGLTTFRPPYTPTTFGAFAGYNRGALFEVTRKTAIDGWAEENGAVFEPVALWRRAWYFPRPGEDMHTAVARECRATRQSLGMFDASTLGKIEIVGPDAAEFMNRMYTNAWTKLAPGRLRYGLLLGEDGFIRDDGVIGRLTSDRFHVTTTTGGAARVLAMMEDYLQTEWPDLRVWLTSTTEQWAVIALNGPNARKLIEPLVEGIDLSDAAFPHMSVAEGRICGVPTRIFRVSFTGELGFEVNVPSRYGRAVWEALHEAGRQYGITPYGTETMHVLRAEKGYIIVGQDTDGTLTPEDAGLGWAIGKAKPDFVGKRSLARPDMLHPGRRQLVGLVTSDPKTVLEEGAQIVADPGQAVPMKMIGHVTSSYWSEALGRSIALAVVEGGRALQGRTVHVPMPGRVHAAEIAGTVFFDPENKRLNA